MPLVNHVRGDQVPDSMLNIRTPIVRIPLWMVVIWWCLKGAGRLAYLYVRYWYVTMPLTGLWWLWRRFGWLGPTLTLVTLATIGAVWWMWHRPSFRRFAWWPIVGRWRLARYRRRWHAAMATAKLAVTFDGTPCCRSLTGCGAGPASTC